MNFEQIYKSVLDQDTAAVVICDLAHTILYMNPTAAERYSKHGGYALVGSNLMNCHNEKSRQQIEAVVAWFAASPSHNRVYTDYNEKENKDVYMVALRDENGTLIAYYEKHEYRNRETAPFYALPE